MGFLALLLFFAFVIGMICGACASYLSSEKGYTGAGWFMLGFFLGIIGLLVAVGLPDKHARAK